MTRGTSRKLIKTRSGFSEIRVERRAIAKPVAAPISFERLPLLPAVLSLADDISRRLRNRTAFPSEFYKGASE